jgi:hypothetical protein
MGGFNDNSNDSPVVGLFGGGNNKPSSLAPIGGPKSGGGFGGFAEDPFKKQVASNAFSGFDELDALAEAPIPPPAKKAAPVSKKALPKKEEKIEEPVKASPIRFGKKAGRTSASQKKVQEIESPPITKHKAQFE